MEATALSVGKSVLDGALGYAKSAIAEEVALQLGVQRDHAFIRDELEMMQAFLRAAHNERNREVLMALVKQVRDVAYDAEDCLQDFSIHLKKPSKWHLRRTLQQRRRIAKKMKELRARVEDVSQRNLRYQLMKSPGSRPETADELSSNTAAAIFGIDEARRAAKSDKPKEDLVDLINKEGEDLRVIAVWGTNGDLGLTSIINAAYENPDIKRKFPCRAWVRISHPFNPNHFIQSLVKQFRPAVGVDILLEIEKTGKELVEEFTGCINENSYLIVLNGLSTLEEWNGIKPFLPNRKKGSRIIVCSSQVEVASLCAGQESQVLELKQYSGDQIIYAFYEKDCQNQLNLPVLGSSSNEATDNTNEISQNQSKGRDETKLSLGKSLTIKTMVSASEESQLIGREKEKVDIIKLISDPPSSEEKYVFSVWGMGGLGKTTLVKDVYESKKLIGMFERRAFVTVMRPFILEEFLKSLIIKLSLQSFEKKGEMDFGMGKRSILAAMKVEELIKKLAELLEGKKSLIVLDDFSSTAEWDTIIGRFPKLDSSCKIVVFKETIDLNKHPELIEEAKLILKKCNGLPLAIATIGGFLANQPKTAMEWRKLNEHISAELEMNPELEAIRSILSKSYDGLPYHLKSCFLYLSIFPEDYKVSRRRLTRRWTAEGYSRNIREKSADEIADTYFMELIDRSMILQSQQSARSRKGIDSCQVHDLMREISISKSTEEGLVFTLEECCTSNTQGTVRHLSVSRNWKGDESEFESVVDLSRIRSLTVFGKWRPFFISDKMRVLRVLDCEGVSGLADHHLTQIAKLLHLKYLSLRGCQNIFHLPDSFGNLRQLETLDLYGTGVHKLPKTITKLRKLQYLRASDVDAFDSDAYEKLTEDLPKQMRNRGCVFTLFSVVFCISCCCIPDLMMSDKDTNIYRHDVCTLACCIMFPFLIRGSFFLGVQIPRGIGNLKALRTMGLVNLTWSRGIIEEIKRLTKLRKLAVDGINKNNGGEFCSVLAELSNLESLLVQSSGEPGLQDCLDGLSSPPKKLQSLKLYGHLVKLPEWINGFHNLVKLTLRNSMILELDATIEVFGKLRNLASLRLWAKSFQGNDIRFNFYPETFLSLTVLELNSIDGLKSVKFEKGAMLKLELLDYCGSSEESNTGMFSGLPFITSLKVFRLDSKTDYKDDFMGNLQAQLAENRNGPVLRRY
ncbi:hypothetical protein HU200_040847 [Digitaria exilis]|uniref:Disease resistance protein RPM1 n=1 Tax=Digitaria exilis TaxID=1010633 RepID=A0A835B858_9POAL|nr:hypothetical protein HU200_040847 [Digitaria exilis]